MLLTGKPCKFLASFFNHIGYAALLFVQAATIFFFFGDLNLSSLHLTRSRVVQNTLFFISFAWQSTRVPLRLA
jgi:hypothetical protein